MAEIIKISYPVNKNFSKFKVPEITFRKKTEDLNPKTKSKIALGAFLGAVAPVVVLNACKKGRVSEVINSFKNKLPLKDKFKAIWNMFEIENYLQILATTTGGVLGGLLGGLKFAKNKSEKEAKYKEGIFEFLNNMTPTTMVAVLTAYSNKTGKFKSPLARGCIILGSVVSGMFLANRTSNKIYEKFFDKNKKKEEKTVRDFKITDTFVHVDDLLNLAVLARIPFASKFQMDKLLPFIYARSGLEVGLAKNNSDKN